MGIALASNIGGMTSPIASPQNVIAVQNMKGVGWISWLAVSIPVCIVCDVLVWMYLLFVFQPSKTLREVLPIRRTVEPWTRSQLLVLITSAVTIILWCLNNLLIDIFGGMGTIAIIPMVMITFI
jgi:phosphate transporter